MPIFQPSMMKCSSSSRARGGGDAGSLTPRCSVTPIRCIRAVIWINTSLLHLVRTTTTTTTTTTGLSSVEAWFSSALDIEEVLSGAGGDQLHIMVSDVIKPFDTVDRSILDCSLGRLGPPAWFGKVYFSSHDHVRLRFKLAAGLGQSWCRDGEHSSKMST